jgi:nucleotide-binding universal stress UspA family protein
MTSVRRLECVLVADDLTARSATAIARAASLPLASHAELHVLHVVDTAVPDDAGARAVADARRMLQERAAVAASVARERSPASETSVATHVVRGEAFVEVVRHARTLGAELVVVGRHRPRRLRDAFIGSTAERVVRKGDVPVLLVVGEATRPYRRVLAAVDLGDTSRRVVELAASMSSPDAALLLVHAYDVPFESTFERSVAPAVLEDIRRERRDEVASVGARLREALHPLGLDCQLVLRRADPRAAITREALRQRADLVVLGTHGRSGIAHALLGSVAEWLIRAAPCDVAVTRPARFTFELP